MGAKNDSRLLVWGGFAALLVAAPWVFSSNFGVGILTQMCIAIVACLSFNILLGQGGMLSFGHAVYSGLGAFVAIHALNMLSAHQPSALWVALIPLVGGVAGLFFALVLGYVTTRRSGTTFSMITLGIGELIFAMALMIPEFFGGEGGISGNRMGAPVLGVTFGPQRQVYYLVACYTFISVAAMYALTRTPLGRMLNAVRDNPERVEFIGYQAQRVRYFAFVIAGFFAGIAGGLAAVNFEIVTAEMVGAARSGTYLLFTFLGGATIFFGPIIGAVLMVLATVLFSELTQAWLLYLGLIFMLMVMYAPGGIASLLMMNVRVAAFGRLGRLVPGYAALLATGGVALLGVSALVEMVYHRQLDGPGSPAAFLGLTLQTSSAAHWLGAAAVATVGLALLESARRRFAAQWSRVQEEIAAIQHAREMPT